MMRGFLCGVILAAAVTTTGVYAQSYLGGVRGLVQDPGKATIATAKVTLLNQGTNVARSELSNALGEFVFSQVNPGTYSLIAEAPGFKKVEQRGIIVGTQEFLTIDLSMEVGAVTESVQVTEEIPPLESSNASQGQVLDNQKLSDLPNLGRNPFMLSKIVPNVIPVGNPAYNRMEDQSGSSQISIAGGPVRGNNYLLDGIPITDSDNRAIVIPSLETVQEVKIQANTYDAEMARTGGGMFNTLMKSGTNEYHGSLYGHLRQKAWDANSYFSNAAGIPIANQPNSTWGAGFGGPIRIPKVYDGRNKTFFYLAYEHYDDTQAASETFAAPTALETQGNFSKSVTSSGAPLVIYDPLNVVNGVRQPFAGDIIPTSRLSPVGVGIASTFQAPQTTPSYYANSDITGSAQLPCRAAQYTAKVDEDFFKWWRASLSYIRYFSLEPGNTWFASASTPDGWRLLRRVDGTQFNNTFSLSPTMVLAVRYGYNRFPNYSYTVSQGYNLAGLGFPANYVSEISKSLAQFPYVSMSNLYSLGVSDNNSTYDHASDNFSTSLSKYLGRHSVKVGFDYRRLKAAGNDANNAGGQYAFNGIFTKSAPTSAGTGGADLADLLLGYPASGTEYTSSKLTDIANYYGIYIQDDFRVTSKLTVNIGLRWEHESGLSEQNNGMVVDFNGTIPNPLAANVSGIAPKGEVVYAGSGNPTTVGDPFSNKWGPRIGLAYQVLPKTVIRGGYGIFFAPQYAIGAPIATVGYNQSTSYIASTDNNNTAANSLSNPFPTGILQPVGKTLGALTGEGQSFSLVDPNARSPYTEQFSLDIQRELPFGIVTEIGYVGSRSRHMSLGSASINENALNPSLLSMGSALTQSVPNPFYGNGGTGVIGTATVQESQLLLPYPTYSSISKLFTDNNKAKYDSLVLKAQKTFSHGITFLSGFTWSRNWDESSGGAGNTLNSGAAAPQNPYNMGSEYAFSNIDSPFRWSTSISYELPVGKGKAVLGGGGLASNILGGWIVNTVSIFQTGFPLQITQSTNYNSGFGYGSQRPNATGTSPITSGSLEGRLNDYINPAAFSTAPEFTFGDVGRTIDMRGPGQVNWDASVFKNFSIKERVKAQFRTEALNAMNTPLFYGPNVSFGSSSFGKITSQANFSRQLQLALRFSF